MMKQLGIFLLAKEANAVAIAFLCALLSIFNVPIGFIATIIVGLITIQKGPKSGFWVLSWVALPTLALLILRRVGLYDVLLLRCAIIWVLASLLYRRRAMHIVLEAAAYTGVVLILLLNWYVPNVQHWWSQELTPYIHQLMASSMMKDKLNPATIVQSIAPMATGVMAFVFLGSVLVELLVARWWQSVITNSALTAPLRISRIAAIGSVLVLLMVLFKMRGAMDAFPLALLPFFIAGLSLLHFLIGQKKQLMFILFFIYAGLIFLPAFLVSMIAIIAFLDTWFNVRKKIMIKNAPVKQTN